MFKKIVVGLLFAPFAKIIFRLIRGSYFLGVLASIYLFRYSGRLFYLLEDVAIAHAENLGLLQSELSGNPGLLEKFLKNNDVVTVKSIRDLGFSANKSVNARKNLEKFGLIRTNPQLDNRGEVIANNEEIERILHSLSEDIFSSDPIMINA